MKKFLLSIGLVAAAVTIYSGFLVSKARADFGFGGIAGSFSVAAVPSILFNTTGTNYATAGTITPILSYPGFAAERQVAYQLNMTALTNGCTNLVALVRSADAQTWETVPSTLVSNGLAAAGSNSVCGTVDMTGFIYLGVAYASNYLTTAGCASNVAFKIGIKPGF